MLLYLDPSVPTTIIMVIAGGIVFVPIFIAVVVLAIIKMHEKNKNKDE